MQLAVHCDVYILAENTHTREERRGEGKGAELILSRRRHERRQKDRKENEDMVNLPVSGDRPWTVAPSTGVARTLDHAPYS